MQSIGTVNLGDEPTVDVPSLPFPRIAYCDAIKMIQDAGEDISWGDDIDSTCDIIAEKYRDSLHSSMADGNETFLHTLKARMAQQANNCPEVLT